MTTRELHAPLFWRLSVEAKIAVLRPHRFEGSRVGLDLLARDLMGMAIDADRDFRSEVKSLIGAVDEWDDSRRGPYRFLDLFRQRELEFELSEGVPPELVRREALRQRLDGTERQREAPDPWWPSEQEAFRRLANDRELADLLRVPGGQMSIPTSNLLARYEPDDATVTLFSKVIDGVARWLNLERRSLANVVFIHETVHAICHLGRDLDGRRWEEFALPSSLDPAFRPSALHEAIAQFFTHRLITRLGDQALMVAFERLSEHQPPEYQAWRKMVDAPVESVRKLLLRARAGLDDTPWG